MKKPNGIVPPAARGLYDTPSRSKRRAKQHGELPEHQRAAKEAKNEARSAKRLAAMRESWNERLKLRSQGMTYNEATKALRVKAAENKARKP